MSFMLFTMMSEVVSALFLLFNYWAYVSYAPFAVRSPPSQPEGDRLLEAFASEFGAPKHCELGYVFGGPLFCFCLCWTTFGSVGSSHDSGS
jgi:hypothetical protein